MYELTSGGSPTKIKSVLPPTTVKVNSDIQFRQEPTRRNWEIHILITIKSDDFNSVFNSQIKK